MVSKEDIEHFINGTNDQKYIVAIEAEYRTDKAYLVINDPDKGKYIEEHKYNAFLWSKGHILKSLYGGDRSKIRQAMIQNKIKIKELKSSNSDGRIPKRMESGFRFIVICDGSNNDLSRFFRDGGYDLKENRDDHQTIRLNPVEQFMIQTGKRLFKGFDEYGQLHKMQFDLETAGLDPSKDQINQIGIRDNRGYLRLLSTVGDTPSERRESESINIITFFEEITKLNPDIITAYNSENFDWPFFQKRCQILGVPIDSISKGLDGKTPMKRVDNDLKLGSETERYLQTYIWGTNVIDVSHSVRRAQAINSDIEKWSLKWITKFSKVSKQNRVYVPGNIINKTWLDFENDYYFNDSNGDWFIYTDSNENNEKVSSGEYIKTTGRYIVERYLDDDLWETEKIDNIYNQAAFLLSKWLPTTFTRSTTMGTATQWKLLLLAWSYENHLAIPDYETKVDFTGGLSFVLKVGYAENVYKFDYAALYPKTTLTYDIFPDTDISGVMKGLLLYVVDTRDTYKNLTTETKEIIENIEKSENINDETKKEIKRLEKLASDYDKKQLPVKILANSFFGAYGAPHLFPWGDIKCAEKITCLSRQNLRFMVKTFSDKFGFIPLVGDTDGVNFSIPKNISDFKYTPKGNHWKTKNKTLEESGVKACLDFYNETYMEKWMGLDIDDAYISTINFSKKNYANLTHKKVKLVGNTVKGKKIQAFISEFLNKGIKLLLNNKGDEFIELYNKTAKDVFEHKIPINKIASKAKVKDTVDSYKKDCTKKNKNGLDKARKAHMELVLANGIEPNLGDTIYYVNIGSSKSDGDVKVKKDKDTGKKEVQLNCVMIPEYNIENDIETFDVKYNKVKYLHALNSKVTPLLVCFSKETRNKDLLKQYKDRKIKEYVIPDPHIINKDECGLVSGFPIKEDTQNTIEWFYTLDDKEIRFWISINETPNHLTKDEWISIRDDYFKRMSEENDRLLSKEVSDVIEIIKTLEVSDLDKITERGVLPKKILDICYVDVDDKCLKSNKFNKRIVDIETIFSYEEDAKIRDSFYKSSGLVKDDNKLIKWNKLINRIYFGTYDSPNLKNNHILMKWVDLLRGFDVDDVINSDDENISELWDLIFSDSEKTDQPIIKNEVHDMMSEVLAMSKTLSVNPETKWFEF